MLRKCGVRAWCCVVAYLRGLGKLSISRDKEAEAEVRAVTVTQWTFDFFAEGNRKCPSVPIAAAPVSTLPDGLKLEAPQMAGSGTQRRILSNRRPFGLRIEF
jgi:hypothetical protein